MVGVKLVFQIMNFHNKCANLFMKFFFPVKNLKEYSSGFRAYKAEIVKKAINVYGNNFIQIKV